MKKKKCNDCLEMKLLSEFYKNARAKDGLTTYCKPCWNVRTRAYQKANPEQIKATAKRQRRKHRVKIRARQSEWYRENLEHRKVVRRKNTLAGYGLTPEDYEKMLKSQKGTCAICKGPPGGRWKHFAVDHDHKTEATRGLLCVHCNLAIGQLEEDTSRMHACVDYLHLHGKGF